MLLVVAVICLAVLVVLPLVVMLNRLQHQMDEATNRVIAHTDLHRRWIEDQLEQLRDRMYALDALEFRLDTEHPQSAASKFLRRLETLEEQVAHRVGNDRHN